MADTARVPKPVARALNRALGRRHVPPPPRSRLAPPAGLRVFSLGIDHVQLDWQALGPGPVRVDGPSGSVDLDADGGPGAVTVSGLEPGTPCELTVGGPGLPEGPVPLSVRTLERPPGEELFRFATVNDAHIGQDAFGFLDTLIELPEPAEAHPVRALRAAVDEMRAWGAEELYVKGDLVDASHASEWAQAAEIVGALERPVLVLSGNHETAKEHTVPPAEGASEAGLALVDGVEVCDRPGLRIVVADTARSDSDWGTIRHVAHDVLGTAGESDRPVFVALHHQPMRFRIPLYWPPGIPGPEARRFSTALGRAAPSSVLATGHTHRHRQRRVGSVTVTEVGSTKDYPGTWAGYQVFEGGIVETTYRIGEPSVIAWTDWTRRAVLGAWQHWSPGTLSDRAWARTW